MKYIFLDNNNGTVSPTGIAEDDKGNLFMVGFMAQNSAGKMVQVPNVINRLTLQAKDPMLSRVVGSEELNQLKAKLQKDSNNNTNNNILKTTTTMNNNNDIIMAETLAGKPVSARQESAILDLSMMDTLNFVFDGTAVLVPEGVQRVMLGDGSNIIANALALPALSPNMVIDGEYGAASLTIFRDLVGGTNVRVHACQISVNLPSWFASSRPITLWKTTINGQVTPKVFNLQIAYDGSQNDPTVRLFRGFRFTFSSIGGVEYRVRPGDYISVNFYVRSAGTVQAMEIQD